jgi:hypothetical protein
VEDRDSPHLDLEVDTTKHTLGSINAFVQMFGPVKFRTSVAIIRL